MGYRGSRARAGGLVVAGLGLSIVLAACGSAAPSASPSASLGAADVSATPTTASPSATPTSASPKPSSKPSVTHHSAKPAAVTNGCYPLSDEGTCYEPGEYCREDDAGSTGRAGDGESIVCENNDGLRWEPADRAATPSKAPPPPPPTSHPPTTASCYPLSDEGTCYEPGEYCRDDDHGVTGRAGNGETIVCEDNDGWRWEPS